MFQITNSKVPDTPAIANAEDDDADDTNNSPKVPKVVFNIEEDRRFLAHSMLIRCFCFYNFIKILLIVKCSSTVSMDIHQTRWPQSFAVQFVYGLPFLSEIVAIIWTAMCFIFQSGVKKHW